MWGCAVLAERPASSYSLGLWPQEGAQGTVPRGQGLGSVHKGLIQMRPKSLC